jgi:hypothetical protein
MVNYKSKQDIMLKNFIRLQIMFSNSIEIDNSSFNNQIQSAIKIMESFYKIYEYKYATNDSGQFDFIRPYVAHSVFRKDILEDAKNILEILRYRPPIDSEELKKYFEVKMFELQNRASKDGYGENSLLKLIKNICSNLEYTNSKETVHIKI